MRINYRLARKEKVTILERDKQRTDTGGVTDVYSSTGTCRATFIPFGAIRSIRPVRDQQYLLFTRDSAHFFVDLRDATATISIETRLERHDGSQWQVTAISSDGSLAQISVEAA